MAGDIKIVNCEGGCGIAESADLKNRIFALLSESFNVILNMSAVQALDLSCIQVILAAKKYAMAHELTVVIGNQISREAVFAFMVAGLVKSPDTSGKEVNRIVDAALRGDV